MKRIQDVMMGIFIGTLMAAAIYAYKTLKPSLPSLPATPTAALAKEKTTTLDCTPVVVYRDKVKDKLGLPETVKRDTAKHATASANVPADDRPHTVTSVYDSVTGVTGIYVRRDALPWIAFNQRWNLGTFYGLRDDSATPVVRVNGSYELLQVKAIHIGVHGQFDTDGRRFGGIGFWYSGR